MTTKERMDNNKIKYLHLLDSAQIVHDSDKLIKHGYIKIHKLVWAWNWTDLLRISIDLYQKIEFNHRKNNIYQHFLTINRIQAKYRRWAHYNRKFNPPFMEFMKTIHITSGKPFAYYAIEIFFLFNSFLIVNNLLDDFKAFLGLIEIQNPEKSDDYDDNAYRKLYHYIRIGDELRDNGWVYYDADSDYGLMFYDNNQPNRNTETMVYSTKYF